MTSRRFKIWRLLFTAAKNTSDRPLMVCVHPIAVIIYKVYSLFIGVDISHKTKIGEGCVFDHGFGLVIHKNTVTGNNVRVRNGVTIGVAHEGDMQPSVLCDSVSIGANAVVIGNVTIGECAVIGAGAVVTKSFPEHQCWAGVPAKQINKNV